MISVYLFQYPSPSVSITERDTIGMIKLRLKRLLSVRFVLLALVIWAIYHVSRNNKSEIDISPFSMENGMDDPTQRYRTATKRSAFRMISEKRDQILKTGIWSSIKRTISFSNTGPSIFKEEDRFIKDWKKKTTDSDRIKKCQFIILTMYYEQPRWSNRDILKFYSNENLDNSLIGLLGERMRTYDYCFLRNGIDMELVFDKQEFKELGIDAWDYQSRMFPFLNKDFSKESLYMWPDIRDLSTGAIENKLNDDSNSELRSSLPNPLQFNINFFTNWLKQSSGKGIVTTMAPSDAGTFAKQLKVFQKLNNTLPIQVISTGPDLTPDFVDEITVAARAANQKVYIIDCSSFFDPTFTEEYIKNFFNKWVAVIMNTFEEAIFIDVDAVPFERLDSFFDIRDYESTGIYMYQDRTMLEEHTFEYCIEMLEFMTPSLQERYFLGSNLFIDDLRKDNIVSTEAMIYENFFDKLRLHHVDSGLVIFNKIKKLNGLLMSFLLHLDGKMQRCVYGDKEIFWLGQLFAGEDYTIDPFEGGIVGTIGQYDIEEENAKKSYICATQIAHNDDKNKLVWTNGGLKTCKIYNSAQRDFKTDATYYTERYGTVENLENMYNMPLHIEGFIVPDPVASPWMQITECSHYMYCAFVTESDSSADVDAGRIIRFDEKDISFYNNVSDKWNE